MKVTPEMVARFEQCKSAEEVMDLANKENISITMNQAHKVFDLLNSEDLSDEMMENVSGGFCPCEGPPPPPCPEH